jgi:hypothetical protein
LGFLGRWVWKVGSCVFGAVELLEDSDLERRFLWDLEVVFLGNLAVGFLVTLGELGFWVLWVWTLGF